MTSSFSRFLPWMAGLGAIFVAFFLMQMFGVRMNVGFPGRGAMLKESISYDSGASSSKMIAPEMYPQPMPPEYYPPTDDVTTKDRSIVRSGSLELEVTDVSAKVSETTAYIASINGLVTQSSVQKYDKTMIGSMQLRVPETKFDDAVAWLQQNVKEVASLSIQSYDQTGQVKQTETRLSDLRIQEAEYEQLLADAQTPGDKLRVQKQLESVRQQIASWQEQGEQLENQAAMSSLYVTYRKEAFSLPILGSLDLSSTAKDALDALVAMVQLLITLIIWTVIFTPLWLPTVLIVKRLQKQHA
jgi:hypothetical protein